MINEFFECFDSLRRNFIIKKNYRVLCVIFFSKVRFIFLMENCLGFYSKALEKEYNSVNCYISKLEVI